MKAKLNCGVIGLGRLGYRHALSIVKNKMRRLLAVADPALSKVKEDFSFVATYNDYTDLLEQESIDAVVIAAPMKTHYEIIKKAIKANKKVFVEKHDVYD